MKSLVSVVLITYSRPDRLQKAIETITNQTYKNMEILVVDGANSAKNRWVVCGEQLKDKRIKYIRVEPEAVDWESQRGMQHSRNVGCKAVKGEFIAMLDDDDEWVKDKIEKQLNAFTNDIHLVNSYCQTGNIIEKAKSNPTYEDLLKSFNVAPTSSFLIRRKSLEDVGYWNEDLQGMHEYDIALKFTKKGYKIYTIPEPLMIRNWEHEQKSKNQRGSYYRIKIAEIMDLWKFYGKDFIPYIGIKGFLINTFRTLGLFGIYLLAYVFKGRVWNVLFPLKSFYDGVSA